MVARLKEQDLYDDQVMNFSIDVQTDVEGNILITPKINGLAISLKTPTITFKPLYRGDFFDSSGKLLDVKDANDFCVGVRVFGYAKESLISFTNQKIES